MIAASTRRAASGPCAPAQSLPPACARDHPVQHRAAAHKVGPRPLIAVGVVLLERRVVPGDHDRRRSVLALVDARRAEIEQYRPAVIAHEHVAGLDVAMQIAGAMYYFEPVEQRQLRWPFNALLGRSAGDLGSHSLSA